MSKTPDNAFVIDLMQHELERLKFMLKSYFRTRNSKIEKYIFYIIQKDLNRLLSKAEFRYAEKIYKLYLKHFRSVFYHNIEDKHFSENLLTGNVLKTDKKMPDSIVDEPDEDKYVFIKAKFRLENVQFENVAVTLNYGGMTFIQYKHIRALFERGQVELI